MTKRWLIPVVLAAGCAEAPQALVRPTMDPEPDADACAPWREDRTTADQEALWRMGLAASHTIVEGRIEAPEGDRARLHIRKVLVGPAFMAGATVQIPIEPSARGGEAIVGFDGNAYPVGDVGGPVWWQPQVIVPASRRSQVEAELGVRAAKNLAVVRIAAADEERTHFEVGEVLAGDVPPRFSVNWTKRIYDAPFPGPADARTRWLASIEDVMLMPDGSVLAKLADLRPDGHDARTAALLAAPRAIDHDTLQAMAERFRLSWIFHRAPAVAISRVTGLADECCTGAGGTYVEHEILRALRGVDGARFVRGGHAYYTTETCGDQRVVALGRVEPASIAPMGFGCGASGERPNAFTDLPVSDVLAETDALPAEVQSWLDAPPPMYQLHSAEDAAHTTVLGPWSQALTLEEALAVTRGHLAHVRIDRVESDGDRHRVTVTIARREGSSMERRATMAFTCGDPRLLVEGSEHLVPFLEEGGAAMLIPGPILPPTAESRRVTLSFVQSFPR